jgi:hypothetical protein
MAENSEPCVHRYRFSDWIPSPIKCIAADPFSEYVAIGRENGDIEVCMKIIIHELINN